MPLPTVLEFTPSLHIPHLQRTFPVPRQGEFQARWYTALVYVHLPAADAQVRAYSLNRLGSSLGGYQHKASGPTSAIRRGAEIVIVPELPGCTFNPTHARLLWLEDWHAAEFRFNATVDLQASPTKQITGPFACRTSGVVSFPTPYGATQALSEAWR